MATEIDSLEIKIQSSLNDVVKNIEAVISGITQIENKISNFGKNKGLDNVSKQAERLSANLDNVGKKVGNAMKSADAPMKKVKQSLEQITEKYKDLGKGFTFTGSTNAVEKQIEKYSNALENAKLKKQELEATGKTEGQMYEYAVKDVIKYSNQIESLKHQLDEMRGSTKEFHFEISGLDDVREKVEEQLRTVNIPESSFNYDPGAMAAVFGEEAASIQNYAQAVEQFGNNAGLALNGLGNESEKVADKLTTLTTASQNIETSSCGKELNSLAGKLQAVNSAGRKTSNTLSKLGSSSNKLSSKLKGLNSSFTRGLKKLLAYGLGIRSVYVLFNKLRNAIREGMKNLVQYSAATNESVSLLNNSFKQMKNASAAMVAPLLNAFAPALNAITQACIKAMNAINQLFASLTGSSTWIKAKTLTDDYAASLKKASSAAKGTTRSFDELNVITAQSSNGSGSGTSASDMFETVEVESKYQEIADKIRNIFTSGDWYGAGAIVGEQINKGINSFPWARTGKTITNTICNALDFASGFINSTDWQKLGNNIVDMINNINLGKIVIKAWDLVIDLAGAAIKLLFGVYQGIYDKYGIAGIIASFLVPGGILTVKLATEIWANIDESKYVQRAEEATKNIREAIEGKWGTFSDWFDQNVITPVHDLFSGLWDGIKNTWSNASTWFKNYVIDPIVGFFKGLWTRVKQIFEGLWIIVQAVWIKASSWFKERVITPIVNVFSPIVERVGGIFSNAWNRIKDIWGKASSWFDNNVIGPISRGFDRLWQGIKRGVISAMNSAIAGIESGINFFVDGVNKILKGFNKVVSWANTVARKNWGGVDLVKKVSLTRINIDQYEFGGFPKEGSLFWANEAGPELVGTMNGRTAVAPHGEITGIRDEIRATSNEEMVLLRQQNALLQAILEKEHGITKDDIGKAARDWGYGEYRRSGNQVFSY